MARGDEENKSPEELEFEKSSSEKAKIGMVEAAIVLIATALADLLELIPLFGIVFGLLISGGVLFWSYFRGMYTSRRRATKLILMLGGSALDFVTLGLFPEAFTLFAAILIHNYGETKHIGGLLQKIAAKGPKKRSK